MENNFKRFLSLLLAFVMVLGMFPMTHAHAEEETFIAIGEKVTSVEANATYVICLHGTMNALSNQQGRGDWGTHTLATGACDKLADARILWTLEPAEGGYKLKNASGYLNISRNSASLNETGHVFDLVNNGDAGWAIKSLDTNEYGNNLGDTGSIGGWSGDGTKFDLYSVYELTADEADPFGKLRGQWSKVSVDTETVFDWKEGQFVYAFDGDPATIWHSNWQGASDKLNGSNTFAGVIDFGKAYTINQFSFTPRVGNNSGIVTQASLYVKETEEAEWILVADHATFENNGNKKDINFDAQPVRFVKFVAEQSNDGWVAVSEFDIDYIPSRVEQLVAEMSLRDKVTQMLMVDFRKWGANVDTATDFTVMNDEVRKIVEDYNFGSVIYFANNIKTTEETFALTQEMQAAATKDGGIALIICADQEGGSVYRLGSGTALPGNMALGATYAANGTKYAYEAGKIIGSELGILGINGNLAPVVDVNNNANNPVIGLRSYGDDAVMVGELASAAIAGMAEYNVIGTAKHFPGHGDTATDSHYGLPMVDKSLEVLMETELAPYTVAIEQGIEMIMTAHILYPQQESDKIVSNKTGEPESLPATMSDDILTGLLKEQMGFEGIVVTDAMNMAGISAKWDQVQSCVIAVQAGVDLICMPCRLYCEADLANLDAIIEGLIAAVEDGTIPMERINDAVTRILTVKENRGILDYKAEDYTLENAQAVVGSAANREMERELAAAAVTVIKNENNTLPLNLTSESKVLMLVPYTNEISQMLMAWNRAMEAGLIPAGAQVDYYRFSNATINATLQAKLDWADTYIINSEINSAGRFTSNHWLYAMPTKLCDYAAANGKTAIISSVDKPYDVQMYANASAIVAAYGCKGSSVDPTEALIGGATGSAAAYGPNIIAAVEVILGTYAAEGKLPVNIPVFDFAAKEYSSEIAYERGYGLTYEAKVGHEHIFEAVVVEPTCTEEGYTAQDCTICDYRIILEKTAALGHTEATIPGKDATCTEDGLTEGKECSVCGEVLTAQENIPALGHSYEDGICVNCGEPDPAAPAAPEKLTGITGEGSSVDTSEPAHDKSVGNAFDGNYDTFWATVPGDSLADAYLIADLGDVFSVSQVDYTKRFDAGAKYNCTGNLLDYVIEVSVDGKNWTKVAAGDTVDGTTKITFEAVYARYVKLTATKSYHWNASQANTVMTAAELEVYGVAADVHEHIPAEAVTENEVPATCTEAGSYDSVIYCSACGEELSRETNTVDALGHDYVVTKVVEPTCTESGYTVYTCSGCGDSYNDDPTEPEHQFDEGVVTDPTCTEKGFTTYTCTVCGEKYVDEASWVDALGHTAAEAVRENEKAPTCTEAGSYDMVVYCSVCGDELSRETSTVGALGHTAAETVVENKMTYSCGAESYDNVVYCSVCGEELSREHVDVPGAGEHNFVLADGKLFCDCGTGYTGPYASNQFFYKDGVRVDCYVLVEYNGDYYFISDYHKYAKNIKLYMTAQVLEGTDFEPGYYEFDADGKMNIAVKNGVVDGYLYIEDVKQTAYTLVQYNGDYYFIGDYNKVTVNNTIYLTAQVLAGTNFQPGYFEFGADGKMVIKNGADADGFFYINGVKQLAYQLIKTDDGDYYFINDGHKYAKSVKLYMTAQALEGTGLNPGYYEFGADGKMDVSVKNGVIDGFLYINDVKQSAYNLVEFEGAYYFISDYHKVAVDVRLYMTAQVLEGTDLKPGYYQFGADGKMIIE